MSAYFVEKETIDLLVSAAVEMKLYAPLSEGRLAPVTTETADLVGQLLWTQNAASVSYRYRRDAGDAETCEMVEAAARYTWTQYSDIKPAAIIGCARNLDYQACETPNYSGSPVHLFCLLIQAEIGKRLAGEGPWGVSASTIGEFATRETRISLAALVRNARRAAPAPVPAPAAIEPKAKAAPKAAKTAPKASAPVIDFKAAAAFRASFQKAHKARSGRA
jgi:hypothetical protein